MSFVNLVGSFLDLLAVALAGVTIKLLDDFWTMR